MADPTPAKICTLDIEGQLVRCIEEPGGKRLWLCDCPKFKERATRHPKDSVVTPRSRSCGASRTDRSRWTVTEGVTAGGRRASPGELLTVLDADAGVMFPVIGVTLVAYWLLAWNHSQKR